MLADTDEGTRADLRELNKQAAKRLERRLRLIACPTPAQLAQLAELAIYKADSEEPTK